MRKYAIEKVKKLFWDNYGLYVISEADHSYKYSHFHRYIEYTLKDENNNTILKHCTLNALGDHLSAKGLYD